MNKLNNGTAFLRGAFSNYPPNTIQFTYHVIVGTITAKTDPVGSVHITTREEINIFVKIIVIALTKYNRFMNFINSVITSQKVFIGSFNIAVPGDFLLKPPQVIVLKEILLKILVHILSNIPEAIPIIIVNLSKLPNTFFNQFGPVPCKILIKLSKEDFIPVVTAFRVLSDSVFACEFEGCESVLKVTYVGGKNIGVGCKCGDNNWNLIKK